MAAGDQFNPGAIEPRDHHIIALLKVQIANAFTQYFFVGHHHALDFQIGTASGERSGNFLANHQLSVVQILRSPDQVQQVPKLNQGIRRGHH